MKVDEYMMIGPSGVEDTFAGMVTVRVPDMKHPGGVTDVGQDAARQLFRGAFFQAFQIIERVNETMHLALLMTGFLAFVVSVA